MTKQTQTTAKLETATVGVDKRPHRRKFNRTGRLIQMMDTAPSWGL